MNRTSSWACVLVLSWVGAGWAQAPTADEFGGIERMPAATFESLVPVAVPVPPSSVSESASAGSPVVPGSTYVVQSGDTLASICERIAGDVQSSYSLAVYNADRLGPDGSVAPGTVLEIPPRAGRPAPLAPSTSATGSTAGTVVTSEPAPTVGPILARAAASGYVTTLSPEFASWFSRAMQIADETWTLPAVTNRYGRTITREQFLLAVIQIESRGVHGRPKGKGTLRSSKGAQGFMQLMPATASSLGVKASDPAANLRGGVRYLGACLDSPAANHPSDSAAERLVKAAASYNAGPGNRGLAKRSWNDYVGRGITESTRYGILLKMGLGLELTDKEIAWFARNQRIRKDDIEAFADDWYAQTRGLRGDEQVM